MVKAKVCKIYFFFGVGGQTALQSERTNSYSELIYYRSFIDNCLHTNLHLNYLCTIPCIQSLMTKFVPLVLLISENNLLLLLEKHSVPVPVLSCPVVSCHVLSRSQHLQCLWLTAKVRSAGESWEIKRKSRIICMRCANPARDFLYWDQPLPVATTTHNTVVAQQPSTWWERVKIQEEEEEKKADGIHKHGECGGVQPLCGV